MDHIGLIEKSNAFQYAMLSTKVCQLLKKIENGIQLIEHDYKTLERGANLLKRIIEGSLLLERKDKIQDFSPSQDGLLAYGHAISAVQQLNMVKNKENFTELFMNLFNFMDALLRGERLERDVVVNLKNFFNMLSKLFSDDIQKDNFSKPSKSISSLRIRAINCAFT